MVKELLRDARVDTTLMAENGGTALWIAAQKGHCDVIKWILASGRELGELEAKGKAKNGIYTPLGIAKQSNHPLVVALLERFTANPVATRRELRLELGVSGMNEWQRRGPLENVE